MPKKETPGVVRQDGTRGGCHLLIVKTPGFSRGVRLKAKPYTKAVRQDGFSRKLYAYV